MSTRAVPAKGGRPTVAPGPYKLGLLELVRARVAGELLAMQAAARETSEAANHPEAKPENDKDTRKLELSYLAAGQAVRVRDLEQACRALAVCPVEPRADDEPIRVGALVTISSEGVTQQLFLLPAGGGITVGSPEPVSVTTPASPLGRALLGQRVGSSVDVVVAGKTREIEVLAVR